MDKAFWRAIANNQYEVPADFALESLTDELLGMLGSSDPELRDYYVYSTLENWLQRELYSPAQLRSMLARLLPNLKEGLEQSEGDHVLLRSFSALTISEIIKYDNIHHVLKESEVLDVLEQSITYLMNEQDLRGHVAGKGWIHALAHAGDLLGTLARSRYLGEHELERLLTAIAEKVTVPTRYVYRTLEEERLALAVIAVLTRKLIPASYWGWWCRHMTEVEEKMHWEDIVRFSQPDDSNAYHNTRAFLHSLYFQLTLAGYKLPGAEQLIAAITRTLYTLDPGFYSVEVIKIIDPQLDTDELRG